MNQITLPNLQELPYAMEEAVNRLRVNVGFFGADVKTIMVISTFPNEGKSLVTVQLWRQMAEAGIDSVLVDMDMRKSVLIEKYGVSEEDKNKLISTASYLAGDMPIEDSIVHTQLEHGDILVNTENVVNPSMLLESDRFSEMLQYLREKYRYVFLDAPPLDLVSDGERIGNHCDGAILVVRAHETSAKALKASISQLERAGCPILGFVLNRVAGSKGGYYTKRYGSYYGGYYGKGYGYYGNTKKK